MVRAILRFPNSSFSDFSFCSSLVVGMKPQHSFRVLCKGETITWVSYVVHYSKLGGKEEVCFQWRKYDPQKIWNMTRYVRLIQHHSWGYFYEHTSRHLGSLHFQTEESRGLTSTVPNWKRSWAERYSSNVSPPVQFLSYHKIRCSLFTDSSLSNLIKRVGLFETILSFRSHALACFVTKTKGVNS